MASCAAEEDRESSAAAELSAMFPNLEWEVSIIIGIRIMHLFTPMVKGRERCCSIKSYIIHLRIASSTQLLRSVLQSHEGSVVPAAHYLVAVLGEAGELPFSEDIGGPPQVLADDLTSDPESPTGSVVVELGDSDLLEPVRCEEEALPSYRNATYGCSPPPPSYDSLPPAPCIPSRLPGPTLGGAVGEDGVAAVRKRPVERLARRLRARRRERMGYHSHKAISADH